MIKKVDLINNLRPHFIDINYNVLMQTIDNNLDLFMDLFIDMFMIEKIF